MNGWMKKWIPILSLVVVPIANAESTGAVEAANRTEASTVLALAPAKSEEQTIQELQAEVQSIRAELDSERSRGEVREYLDQDSHPLWP
jgi:hypothetical protein